jgi:hypothetical protein
MSAAGFASAEDPTSIPLAANLRLNLNDWWLVTPNEAKARSSCLILYRTSIREAAADAASHLARPASAAWVLLRIGSQRVTALLTELVDVCRPLTPASEQAAITGEPTVSTGQLRNVHDKERFAHCPDGMFARRLNS